MHRMSNNHERTPSEPFPAFNETRNPSPGPSLADPPPPYEPREGQSSGILSTAAYRNESSRAQLVDPNTRANVHTGHTPGASSNIEQIELVREKTTMERLQPKNWGKKTWAFAVVGGVAAVIGIVVGSVVGVRNAKYPDYSQITYALADTYEGTNFFDNFDYFTGWDPTHGFVHYVPNATATELNLTYASTDRAILRVDTSQQTAPTGRYSVRVTSKKKYDSGLFIFDVYRSPYGCATWPALWLSDPNPLTWPANGEIDVVEAVNAATTGNQMTLHTSFGCLMNRKRKLTGRVLSKDCWNNTNANEGCGVQGSPATFGQTFNQNGGGIYAMELRDAGIRIWFFPRSSIPSNVPSPSNPNVIPDPSTWGTALADFPSSSCDIPSHFRNQSIIANINLCGDWAGRQDVFSAGGNCPGLCADWVAGDPSRFANAVWEFGSWKVYKNAG